MPHGMKWMGWKHWFRTLGVRADFAYATILLIQLRRIWNIWRYRDLSGGDTCAYFDLARLWFTHLRSDVVWSPLYTIFYGTLLHFQPDAAAATMLHRVLIILAAAVLVLAVARQILPKPLAWLLALWWVMLPVHFDPMYEVHLFAHLPILLCWWVLAGPPSAWRRGIGLGLLLLEALLVRNEYILSFACLSAALIWYERRQRFTAPWRAYAIPIVSVCAAFMLICIRTPGGLGQIRKEMRVKHGLNMAQVYAYGYSQRHPEWQQDPWTEYESLTTRDFGAPQPSLVMMIRRDPSALLKHVAWNFRLLPAGLQLLLLGATSGSVDPDYATVMLNRRYALVLGVFMLGIVIAGAILCWKQRRLWKRAMRGRWNVAWLAIGSVILVMPLIIATQRPRAEYLYPLGVFLMILAILGAYVVIARRPRVRRNCSLLPPLLLLPALCVPSVYHKSMPRPLRAHYDMLRALQPKLERPETTFLSNYGSELEHYLGYNRSQFFDYSIFKTMPADQSLAAYLDARGINLIDLAPHD